MPQRGWPPRVEGSVLISICGGLLGRLLGGFLLGFFLQRLKEEVLHETLRVLVRVRGPALGQDLLHGLGRHVEAVVLVLGVPTWRWRGVLPAEPVPDLRSRLLPPASPPSSAFGSQCLSGFRL